MLACAAAAQQPVHIAFECTESDTEAFGLTCTMEDPCPVFLELSSADAAAGRLIAAGNLHTKDVTLYGIVLASDDNGATWSEPIPRLRGASLEQIEFLDLQNGWISGESIDPLARDPFLLVTSDAGQNWRRRPILEDTKYATISQFHFDTPAHGELVLDASQPKKVRQELYESMTGGESWEVKQVSNTPVRLKNARAPGEGPLRVRTEAASGSYIVERGGGRTWQPVASFPVHVADCQ